MGSEQKNAFMAIVLSGLILFAWQFYFAPQKKENAPIEPTTTSAPVGAIESAKNEVTATGPIEPAKLESFELKTPETSLVFDSELKIHSMSNTQAAFDFADTVASKNPLKVEFNFGEGYKTLLFAKAGESEFVNTEHQLTLKVEPQENGVFTLKLYSPKEFKYRFTFTSENKKLENGQQRYFSYFNDSLNHISVNDEENGDKVIKWAGIDFNYHLFAFYFEKEEPLLFKSTQDGAFNLQTSKATNALNFSLVFAKKEYNDLTALGHNLNKAVDFGIWGFFAVWILKGLQFFHTFIPNWGVAVILLTLVIRLITFPLQYKSFASMKKLQVIQPELTKIREKFKDDPARMQKESMELFKKSGANPLGGCLPLLLQMPVFFAFYKVLYGAVELVDAPFVLWIQDLSNKDPYFVLPVLMTLVMFVQQKITPNTITDPVQRKVMMFMPVIFGFIMKDLPSGLCLYIFVSTLFGILQQLLVFSKKTA